MSKGNECCFDFLGIDNSNKQAPKKGVFGVLENILLSTYIEAINVFKLHCKWAKVVWKLFC